MLACSNSDYTAKEEEEESREQVTDLLKSPRFLGLL